jgi:hypothetical protein
MKILKSRELAMTTILNLRRIDDRRRDLSGIFLLIYYQQNCFFCFCRHQITTILHTSHHT